jgi:hypothetical protein
MIREIAKSGIKERRTNRGKIINKRIIKERDNEGISDVGILEVGIMARVERRMNYLGRIMREKIEGGIVDRGTDLRLFFPPFPVPTNEILNSEKFRGFHANSHERSELRKLKF